MKRCKVNRWFLAKRGIGNDKVVHPFECIRMPLDFAMLAKRFFCDGQPFPQEKFGVAKRERIAFKCGGCACPLGNQGTCCNVPICKRLPLAGIRR